MRLPCSGTRRIGEQCDLVVHDLVGGADGEEHVTDGERQHRAEHRARREAEERAADPALPARTSPGLVVRCAVAGALAAGPGLRRVPPADAAAVGAALAPAFTGGAEEGRRAPPSNRPRARLVRGPGSARRRAWGCGTERRRGGRWRGCRSSGRWGCRPRRAGPPDRATRGRHDRTTAPARDGARVFACPATSPPRVSPPLYPCLLRPNGQRRGCGMAKSTGSPDGDPRAGCAPRSRTLPVTTVDCLA